MAIFRNRFQKGEILKEQEPEYWEETSYFRILPKKVKLDPTDKIVERIKSTGDVELVDFQPYTAGEIGSIIVSYKGDVYEAGYFVDDFHFSDSYNLRTYFFSDDELSAIRIADTAVVLFMNFGSDRKDSYHLQLKLAVALVPDMIAIIDESAERVVNARWVNLAAQSQVPPGPSSLFTVQAVCDNKNNVWLHTHGLTRCGVYELEILGSDTEHCNDHYNLLSSFASRLLDNEEDEIKPGSGLLLGLFEEKLPIVATHISWTKGIKEYERSILGGIEDRKEGHNTHTALIFLYSSEEDEKKGIYHKVNECDELLANNPLFFLSNTETQRMSDLARERFGIVKYMAQKGAPIIIKAGLKTDSGEQEDEREHIWFELMEIDGSKIKGKLTQEPYDISKLHAGDEVWFTEEEITDWRIYLEDYPIDPDTAYLLI